MLVVGTVYVITYIIIIIIMYGCCSEQSHAEGKGEAFGGDGALEPKKERKGFSGARKR